MILPRDYFNSKHSMFIIHQKQY